MENVKTFHFTPHSVRRLCERGISAEDMKGVVKHHEDKDFQSQGEHSGKVYRFSRHLCNGKKLVVIGELKRAECWIITAYYE